MMPYEMCEQVICFFSSFAFILLCVLTLYEFHIPISNYLVGQICPKFLQLIKLHEYQYISVILIFKKNQEL